MTRPLFIGNYTEYLDDDNAHYHGSTELLSIGSAIGKKLGLHPLFILLSVVGGLLFFGPAGIFLGPLTMSLLFALVEVYIHIFNIKETKQEGTKL